MIHFEFDPDKSQNNLEKHGIDFQGARRLWSDPNLLEIAAKSDDEPRFLMIGLIDDKHWAVSGGHASKWSHSPHLSEAITSAGGRNL